MMLLMGGYSDRYYLFNRSDSRRFGKNQAVHDKKMTPPVGSSLIIVPQVGLL